MNNLILKSLLMISILFIQSVFSHPHIFIQAKTNLIFKGDNLNAIEFTWEFDEMNSMMMIQDFDGDGDGVFSTEENKYVEHEAFSYSANSSYFATVKVDGKEFQYNGSVNNFQALIVDGMILRYKFKIPVTGVSANPSKIEVHVDDPDLFIGFSVAPFDKDFKITGSSNYKFNSRSEKVVVYAKK